MCTKVILLRFANVNRVRFRRKEIERIPIMMYKLMKRKLKEPIMWTNFGTFLVPYRSGVSESGLELTILHLLLNIQHVVFVPCM